jgi:hypothetical protein
MPYPIAVVNGTDNTVISYFSGAVPVDPNVTVVVNLNGYTSNVIDMGPRGNTDGAGVNVRVDVQKLNGLNQVQFFIETSDNGIDGWNLCAADDTTAFVTGPVELLIHFETDRRFFRLAWSGEDAPDASTPPNYPAGNYALSYLFGCFNFGPLPSEAGSWSIQTNATNGTTVEGYAPFGVPPPPYEYHNPWNLSEATEQAYWAGLLLPFTHAGGPIGVQCGDPFTGDNTEGSPPTTWALRSETEVTFSWSYAVSNRGL